MWKQKVQRSTTNTWPVISEGHHGRIIIAFHQLIDNEDIQQKKQEKNSLRKHIVEGMNSLLQCNHTAYF
jgi:hypothetical protein